MRGAPLEAGLPGHPSGEKRLVSGRGVGPARGQLLPCVGHFQLDGGGADIRARKPGAGEEAGHVSDLHAAPSAMVACVMIRSTARASGAGSVGHGDELRPGLVEGMDQASSSLLEAVGLLAEVVAMTGQSWSRPTVAPVTGPPSGARNFASAWYG